jgi:hypothetical protein
VAVAAHTASPEDVVPCLPRMLYLGRKSKRRRWPERGDESTYRPVARTLVEFDDAFNWDEQRRLGLGFQEYP